LSRPSSKIRRFDVEVEPFFCFKQHLIKWLYAGTLLNGY